jgi:alpha-D-ribose 1-methylphosphonate 5-triphosphate synthase subunit PhnI
MSPLLIPILGISCGLLAIFGGVFVKPWFAYQHRRLELEALMVAEKAAQYAAQTERLEQRVRVLERIVTDRGMDLSDEIERLRDDRPEPVKLG